MAIFQRVKWIEEGHRLGLIFADGVIFLRCLTIERTFYENWTYAIDLLAAAGGNQIGYEIKDSAAQKLLEVPYDQREKMIIQAAIGVNPPWVRVYPEFPSGHKLGRIPGIDPVSVGDPYGFKTGEDAPFMDCSDALEFFSIYGISPLLNFYNPHETRKAQPCLRIEMTKAAIELYDPENPVDRELIGKMARGIATVRLVSMGPIEDPVAWKSIDGWPKPIKMEAAKEYYKGK